MGSCFIFLITYTAVSFRYTGSSNYLDYLFSLNYWSSNTLFILSFIFFFTPIFSAWIYFFFLKFCVIFKTTVVFFFKKTTRRCAVCGYLNHTPLFILLFANYLVFKGFFSQKFLPSRLTKFTLFAANLVLIFNTIFGGVLRISVYYLGIFLS